MTSQTDDIFTCLHDIGAVLLTKGSKGLGCKSDGNFCALSGCHFLGLGIADQFLIRLVKVSFRQAGIDLYHFFACAFSCIYHLGCDCDLLFICDNILCLNSKCRVRKSVTKRIGHFFSDSIKITIAHIDTLTIVGIIRIAKALG